jgi:hypothetical protein
MATSDCNAFTSMYSYIPFLPNSVKNKSIPILFADNITIMVTNYNPTDFISSNI